MPVPVKRYLVLSSRWPQVKMPRGVPSNHTDKSGSGTSTHDSGRGSVGSGLSLQTDTASSSAGPINGGNGATPVRLKPTSTPSSCRPDAPVPAPT